MRNFTSLKTSIAKLSGSESVTAKNAIDFNRFKKHARLICMLLLLALSSSKCLVLVLVDTF